MKGWRSKKLQSYLDNNGRDLTSTESLSGTRAVAEEGIAEGKGQKTWDTFGRVKMRQTIKIHFHRFKLSMLALPCLGCPSYFQYVK